MLLPHIDSVISHSLLSVKIQSELKLPTIMETDVLYYT